jgi:hypothetical protein
LTNIILRLARASFKARGGTRKALAGKRQSIQVDCVLLQFRKRRVFEHDLMGRRQHELRRRTRAARFNPAHCAQAPAVAWFEAGEAELGMRRGEIIAVRSAESKEFCRDADAYDVRADVFVAGVAAAIAEKTG